MFLTSTFRPTFFDEALPAQCSVKKSQSKSGSWEHLKILPYNIMTLQGGWVGQKKGPKHAYVIYEWSLSEVQ